ncbi:alpha/beta-hydrolase [Bimuria novae-zelandiae CBS 107.79]|uniref:Carboxylic ester hydrolase n=1 Tax=Bimuria novae-zelandiae CBS 107.79 TaxID=1447943 RepID=A0A6A5VGK4_9PLEO|nr:alpha/beta-hydrolase [Bimuria novae-zelandiae CBS 107.79]
MKVGWLLSLAIGASALSVRSKGHRQAPTVTVRNGTYKGVHSDQYDQDFFLGLPFAQPPTGDLRFRSPRPLNSSWKGQRDATAFSPACVGYGPSQMGYNVSEDCLYLNVIRPTGYHSKKHCGLPVAVWIYGGGFVQGSGVDRRYNLSFIVQESARLGQPILGITLNYRLSAWGFLQGDEVRESGDTNVGLRDQRLALQWIRENVAAFGGDPDKVTIWGQSAGAGSVGMHITAYNGRDDKLFRSAIMQSGSPVALSDLDCRSYFQSAYRNLTEDTRCSNATESLEFLRALPFETLNAVINTTALSGIWFPQIDGDIIARYSSSQLEDGGFVHVPILIRANSDEGTSFSPKGINNTEIFKAAIQTQNVLANLGPTYRPGPPYGEQYRRAATYYGDAQFIASRRLSCETWAAAGLTAYCFRFNTIPAWATQFDGATHFVEVASSMLNLLGVGYPPVRVPPFEGKPESYADLTRLMSGDLIRFINSGNFNSKARERTFEVPYWPKYALLRPEEFVYDASVTSYVEPDTYRAEGMKLINSGVLPVYGR